MMRQDKEFAWHSLSLEETEKELNTNFHVGLSSEESKRRLEASGPNELPLKRGDSIFLIFLRQFRSPLIYILLLAAAVVLWMNEIIDGSIIIFVLVFNALMGTIQEGRAQNTLMALRKFVKTVAAVIRDGKEVVTDDTRVVPGDIVVLDEGSRVPADARIFESYNLAIDESALTGESVPVYKENKVFKKDILNIAEQKNMVFKGTYVVRGGGRAVVVATGKHTVMGKISEEVAAINTEVPLRKDIRYLSRLIVLTILAIGAGIFLFGAIRGDSQALIFRTVVSLLVSVIPEGLPVVLTLVLATGIWRMAKRNVIVKQLQAVEALGQARVIAVDKTGTLTRNELVVREVFVDGKKFIVGGTGYESKGEMRLEKRIIDPPNHPELLTAGKVAVLSARAKAVFREQSNTWQVVGDPTEAAIMVFSEKLGFNKDDIENESPLLGEIPFDYKLKHHATSNLIKDGRQFIAVVGAPEVVLEKAEKILKGGKEQPFTKILREEVELVFREMSGRGLRVVAFGFNEKPVRRNDKSSFAVDVENITFGGFYGIEDSLRKEVAEALRLAAEGGIRVVMITGDHRLTAVSVAKSAGIFRDGDKVITGEELEKMSEKELADNLDKTSVFARVTPDHKLKIIQSYRRKGDVIAMTGDGVNDAPSLVAADLGVAMGNIGTEVAKEASDLVLLDDNFGSIVAAIEEGRSIFKTIKKVILYLFSTSVGEVITIVGAMFLGFPLPISPAQIIWLNLVTDGFLDVALAMEPKEDDLLKRKFSRPNKYLVDGLMLRRMIT
ncbi:MAG: HAD-IC family P-type ATPase, partial [Patescibacteria group bacterium]